MKKLIYRFAIWLEYRAIDLQCWAEPTIDQSLDLTELVIGGINRDPSPFWKNNALLNHLKDRD
jgi:hypothetical protein